MRHSLIRPGLAMVAGLGVLGCQVEGPTDITDPPANLSIAGIEQEAATPRHIVMFNNQNTVPNGFADDVANLGGTVEHSLGSVGIATVAGLSDEAVAELNGRNDVNLVMEDEIFQLELPTAVETASEEGGVASPGDPSTAAAFGRQWGLRAISADVAWAAGRLGSPDVTVAILDTGIDYTYPDLAGRVDLSRSVSFQPFDDSLVDLFFPGRHHVSDLHYHGTHVASTVSSNAFIVAGVTSQTTLIGVKVCSVFGSCPSSAVLAGIVHAAENGADVANMSLGGGFFKSQFPGFVSVIDRVTNFARQQGTLIVVSAGNSAADLDHNGNFFSTYCDTPAVACVSATGPTFAPSTAGPFVDVDTPSPFTNFGRSAVSVAAPGGNGAAGIGGFVWQACSQTSLQIPVCQTGIFILGLTGTSMSSPHAAGVAALLAEDGTSGTALRSRLQQTADDLGQPGTDPFYGKGRVNAARAAGAQ